MNTDNLRVKWIEVEASVWEAQQEELKALREENERLTAALTPQPIKEGIYPWAEPLEKTRQKAEFWLDGGRKAEKDPERDRMYCQAMFTWMNFAYHYAEKAHKLESQLAGLQARYDALMLEFCPEEMTAEQLQEWGMNQVPESQLAELRQGGEAMIQELRDLQSRIHFDPLPRFNVPDEIDRIIDNFRADADPQPAIPPGHGVVPLIPTRAMEEVVNQDEWQWEDLLAAAEAITEDQYNEITSAPAIPPGYVVVKSELFEAVAALVRFAGDWNQGAHAKLYRPVICRLVGEHIASAPAIQPAIPPGYVVPESEGARTHELKVWPTYFQQVKAGTKTFEVRKDDRDFNSGDHLILREYEPAFGYTGDVTERMVGFILRGPEWGIAEGYCVMSLASAPAIPPGYVVPDAMTFLRDNDMAASDDWMQGWNDCRAMIATPADSKEGE